MREPNLHTKLLGHPAVVLFAWVAGGCSLYAWVFINSAIWPLTLAGVFVMARTVRANDRLRTWQQWQRDWNAMGEEPRR